MLSMRPRRPLALATLCLALAASAAHARDQDDGEDEDKVDHAPNEWFLSQRTWPAAKLDQAQRVADFDAALRFQQSTPALGGTWQFAGPDNIGGRITDIQSSPLAPETLYAGTASGGVFRSKDGGKTFQPVFENEPSLSIGALAIDPKDPSVVWAGTGEANSSGATYAGTGIYRSSDGGDTWTHMGLLEMNHIGRIAVDPNDGRTVFVAALGNLFLPSAERGVYRTKDGGKTWQLVLHTNDRTGAVDVSLDPKHPGTLYAALWERQHTPSKFVSGGKGSGLYKSTDGGDHWQQLTNGLPASTATTGRIGVAVAPSRPETVYAIFDDTESHFNGVYKSTDAGAHWQRTNDGSLGGMYAEYGWWFGNIRVDPTNPDVVYPIGFTSYKSTDGGRSYRQIGGGLHADHHALYVDPANPQRLFHGNDGGFFVSTDGGRSWQGPATMPITQLYSVAVDQDGGTRLFGGAQDNGVVATFSGGTSDWTYVNDGDGFQVQLDPVDKDVVYSESQNGGLGKSTDGGHSFDDIRPEDAARANWDTPLLLDPNDHRVLYFGADRLFRSRDAGGSWEAVSPDLSNPKSLRLFDPLVLGTITAIAVPKADSKVIYAGTDNGKVWVTRDDGAHWTEIDQGLPQRWVTGLAANPTNPAQVVLTVSGYRFGEPLAHVFRSDDYGATWQDIHANLPEIPVNVVRIDPAHPSTYYLGTDAGAYATTDAGAHWQPLGSGLPMSPVIDLTIDPVRQSVYAATFGRSLHRLDLSGR